VTLCSGRYGWRTWLELVLTRWPVDDSKDVKDGDSMPHSHISSSSILFTKYSNKQKHVTYRETSNMA